jgi:hypothetical protein
MPKHVVKNILSDYVIHLVHLFNYLNLKLTSNLYFRPIYVHIQNIPIWYKVKNSY